MDYIIYFLFILFSIFACITIPYFLLKRSAKVRKYYEDHPEEAKAKLIKIKKRNEDKKIFTKIFVIIIGIIFILAGMVLFGYQIFLYLWDGNWHSISLMTLLLILEPSPWIRNPETWLGLHKILSIMPLSLTLIVFGFLIING